MAGKNYKYKNSPVSFKLESEIKKAQNTIENFSSKGLVKDSAIPTSLLRRAKGIAFMTVAKAGFIFAGRIGTGLVVAKLPDGRWSAPCAIGSLGMSWGALVGGEITDFVLLLNTDSAVQAFLGTGGQVHLGAELGVAAGPVGRTGAGSVALGTKGAAPVYSYSHSRGLYGGLSLEGTVVKVRNDVNTKFYGRPVVAQELLSGQVYPPAAAQPLYRALDDATAGPSEGFDSTNANAPLNRGASSSSAPPLPPPRPSWSKG